MNNSELPSIGDFYDTLTNKHLSEDLYEQAKWVWSTFKCDTFENYHDLYLKMDVMLLVDIWINFRQTCINNYKLSPDIFYTSPGLAWEASLLMAFENNNDFKLDLYSDPNMYLFIE